MIRLESVRKQYPGGLVAVEDLSLDVPDGEVCVLVGPSGCGKTTILRMINRLIEPSGGRILVDGEDILRVDPVELRRRIGYVIQQVGLFPHQTVATNIATVPRLLGWDRARVTERVDELLELVGLPAYDNRNRYPAQLSGGQRQRVGVARALAADPPIMLMDEPFAAIDPVTRTQLQDEFLRLQQTLRKTIVFVTHDIDEAVKMGDRIAILQVGGCLAQYDPPDRLLASPANDFVADFVGRDRALKRLRITRIDLGALHTPPTAGDISEARAALESNPLVVVVVDAGAGADANGGVAVLAPGDDAPVVVPGVEHDRPLQDALALMLERHSAWVAVTQNGRYLGLLGINDFWNGAVA
ncbi:MAG: betaine/proline/choline family ABC transporter ATP-binding protein [Actinomycetota bacterium]|nr:betaine/proline/choline family ABC transporter ATP-binding protein [Actinomycetota bacterium]